MKGTQYFTAARCKGGRRTKDTCQGERRAWFSKIETIRKVRVNSEGEAGNRDGSEKQMRTLRTRSESGKQAGTRQRLIEGLSPSGYYRRNCSVGEVLRDPSSFGAKQKGGVWAVPKKDIDLLRGTRRRWDASGRGQTYFLRKFSKNA